MFIIEAAVLPVLALPSTLADAYFECVFQSNEIIAFGNAMGSEHQRTTGLLT